MPVIVVPPANVIEAIEDGTARITRRLEIYERDGSTLWTPTGEDPDAIMPRLTPGASVSIDATRDERRTLDAVLDNRDGILHPNPYSGLWYDKILKPYKGVRLRDGSVWECQVGEFMIDGIDYENFPSTVHVVCRDYTKKMLLSKFTNSATFDPATRLGDLVKALAINSGIREDQLDIPNNTPELGKSLDVAPGTTRWEIARDACTAKDYELFFSATGMLIMRPFRDPLLDAVQFIFKTGPDGNLVSLSKSVNDSEIYNHIVYSGASGDNAVGFFGRAKNTEPSSPTSIANIGERVYIYENNALASDDEAKAAAESKLKKSALESYDLRVNSISYPWIEVGYIGQILDPQATTSDPDKYLLSSATLSLDPGPMEVTGRRLTIIKDTEG